MVKKLSLVLVVVLGVVLAGCSSPAGEPEVVEPVNPFEGRWLIVDSGGVIKEYRDNNVIYSSGITTRFEYDDIYYNEWMTGNMSHIYISYEYEFRDNGNELHLNWVPNLYGAVPADKYIFYRKIGD